MDLAGLGNHNGSVERSPIRSCRSRLDAAIDSYIDSYGVTNPPLRASLTKKLVKSM